MSSIPGQTRLTLPTYQISYEHNGEIHYPKVHNGDGLGIYLLGMTLQSAMTAEIPDKQLRPQGPLAKSHLAGCNQNARQ